MLKKRKLSNDDYIQLPKIKEALENINRQQETQELPDWKKKEIRRLDESIAGCKFDGYAKSSLIKYRESLLRN